MYFYKLIDNFVVSTKALLTAVAFKYNTCYTAGCSFQVSFSFSKQSCKLDVKHLTVSTARVSGSTCVLPTSP